MSNEDIYWFVNKLIEKAENFLEKKEYSKALSECLISSNHDHSGWTDDINKIYRDPQNDQEKIFSERLHKISFKTAIGLLETLKPSKDFSKYVCIGGLVILLLRLSQKGSCLELVEKTGDLIDKSMALGANENLGLIKSAVLSMQIFNEREPI